ncbi:MAG: Ig-like domain-containing protein [Propionibacteriaceae bacterium]|nr:Ig-like domain-containing protein [Propionibacteriaceae bacterium]
MSITIDPEGVTMSDVTDGGDGTYAATFTSTTPGEYSVTTSFMGFTLGRGYITFTEVSVPPGTPDPDKSTLDAGSLYYSEIECPTDGRIWEIIWSAPIRFTALDDSGYPIRDLEVAFAVDYPFAPSSPTAVTDEHGVASVDIVWAEGADSIHYWDASHVTVTASAAGLSWVSTVGASRMWRDAFYLSGDVQALTTGAVLADGTSAHEVQVRTFDQCGVPVGDRVWVSLEGSAHISSSDTLIPSSFDDWRWGSGGGEVDGWVLDTGPDGVAILHVTDTVAETAIAHFANYLSASMDNELGYPLPLVFEDGVVPTEPPTTPPGPVFVYMPDPVLRGIVNGYLGQDAAADITYEQARTLTDITDFSDKMVANLTGLEAFTNLSSLGFNSSNISNLTPLAGLTKLSSVMLVESNISDLTPLAGLTRLRTLILDSNQIGDLSPISGLTDLEILSVMGNKISDLAPLSGLANLEGLDIWGNQVSDLTPLSGLNSLRQIMMAFNQVSDLSPIGGLTNLVELFAMDNQISDLAPLSGLSVLRRLAVDGNQVSDLAPLSGLSNLRDLSAGRNQISDLTPIGGLFGLTSLSVDHNQISDWSTLAGLDQLSWLNISYNEVSDLTPLAGLSSLSGVLAIGNHITDLSPLATTAAGYRVDARDQTATLPAKTVGVAYPLPIVDSVGVALLPGTDGPLLITGGDYTVDEAAGTITYSTAATYLLRWNADVPCTGCSFTTGYFDGNATQLVEAAPGVVLPPTIDTANLAVVSGTATPGTTVTVSLVVGTPLSALVGADGRWAVTPPITIALGGTVSAYATDSEGNQSETVTKSVPEMPYPTYDLEPTNGVEPVLADGVQSWTGTVTVVDGDGNRLPGLDPSLVTMVIEPEDVAMSDVTDHGDGTYSATFTSYIPGDYSVTTSFLGYTLGRGYITFTEISDSGPDYTASTLSPGSVEVQGAVCRTDDLVWHMSVESPVTFTAVSAWGNIMPGVDVTFTVGYPFAPRTSVVTTDWYGVSTLDLVWAEGADRTGGWYGWDTTFTVTASAGETQWTVQVPIGHVVVDYYPYYAEVELLGTGTVSADGVSTHQVQVSTYNLCGVPAPADIWVYTTGAAQVTSSDPLTASSVDLGYGGSPQEAWLLNTGSDNVTILSVTDTHAETVGLRVFLESMFGPEDATAYGSPVELVFVSPGTVGPPTIDAANLAGVSGTGTPGTTVSVTFPYGELESAVVGADGMWSLTSPVTIALGGTVSAYATDSEGNESDTVSIEVPQMPSPTYDLEPTKGTEPVVADGVDSWTGTVTIVDGYWDPLPGLDPSLVTITIDPEGVTMSDVTDHGDGTYSATFTSTTPGDYSVTTSFMGFTLGRGYITFADVPTPDFGNSTLDGGTVSIESVSCPDPDGPVWFLGSGPRVTFTAVDAIGDPVPGVDVLFEATYPFVSSATSVTTDAHGVATATLSWAEGADADSSLSGWSEGAPVTVHVGDQEWTSAVSIRVLEVGDTPGGHGSAEALTQGSVIADGSQAHEVQVSTFDYCNVPAPVRVYVWVEGSAQVASSHSLTPERFTVFPENTEVDGWILDLGSDVVATLQVTDNTAETAILHLGVSAFSIENPFHLEGTPLELAFVSPSHVDPPTIGTANLAVVSGTGTPGATVSVTFPYGETVTAVVGADGQWSLTPPVAIALGGTLSAYATDSEGIESDTVSIEVPQMPSPTYDLEPTKGTEPVFADGVDSWTGTVTIVDGYDHPLPGLDPSLVTITIEPEGVVMSDVTDHGDGTYSATFTSTTPDEYSVTTSFMGFTLGRGYITFAEVPVPAGTPDPDKSTLDGGWMTLTEIACPTDDRVWEITPTAPIRFTALDDSGYPIRDLEVSFTVDFPFAPSAATAVTDEHGVASVDIVWAAGADETAVWDTSSITVTASAAGHTWVSGVHEVYLDNESFYYGAAVEAVTTGTVLADGTSGHEVRVTTYNRCGVPVADHIWVGLEGSAHISSSDSLVPANSQDWLWGTSGHDVDGWGLDTGPDGVAILYVTDTVVETVVVHFANQYSSLYGEELSDPLQLTFVSPSHVDTPTIGTANLAVVSGTGTPGATVTVHFPYGELESAVVGADGQWSLTPPVTIALGGTLSAYATDSEGNESDTVSIEVPQMPSPTYDLEPTKGTEPVFADGVDSWTGTVTIVDGYDHPLPGLDPSLVTITIEPEGVTMSDVTDHGDGTYSATFTSTIPDDYSVTTSFMGFTLGRGYITFAEVPVPTGTLDPDKSGVLTASPLIGAIQCPDPDGPVWDMEWGGLISFRAVDSNGDPMPGIDVSFETVYPFVPSAASVTTDADGWAAVTLAWAEGGDVDSGWSFGGAGPSVTVRVGDLEWTFVVLINWMSEPAVAHFFGSVEALTSGSVIADGSQAHEVQISTFGGCNIPVPAQVFVWVEGSAQVTSPYALIPGRFLIGGVGPEVDGWIVDPGSDVVTTLRVTDTTAETAILHVGMNPFSALVPQVTEMSSSPLHLVFEPVSSVAPPTIDTANLAGISGTGTPGTTVTVTTPYGDRLTAPVGDDGLWSMTSPITIVLGGTLSAYATDAAGVRSITVTLDVPQMPYPTYDLHPTKGSGAVWADGVDSWTGTVAILDGDGVPLPGLNPSLVTVVIDPADVVVMSGVTDHGDGTYTVTFTSTTPGDFLVEVFLTALPLGSDYITFAEVPVPAEPDPDKSTLDGGDIHVQSLVCPTDEHVFVLSTMTPVIFTALDAAGDPIPGVEVSFAAEYPFAPSATRVVTDGRGEATVFLEWAEGGDTADGWKGSLSTSVTATVGDENWTASVRIGTNIIDLRPYKATVEALTSGVVLPDGTSSHEVLVSTFTQCGVPQTRPVWVYVTGTAQITSSDSFIPATFVGAGGETVNGWILDTGADAVATLEITNTAAETVTVYALLDSSFYPVGTHATGSPLGLTFGGELPPEVPDPDQSSVVLTSGSVRIGTSVSATATVKDSSGDVLSGIVVTFTATGDAELSATTCTTDITGQCSVQVSASVVGDVEVSASVNGQAIAGSPSLVSFYDYVTPPVLTADVDYPSVVLGETQVATAHGFAPGESVVVTLKSDPVALGTHVADGTGKVEVTFTVPVAVGAGSHVVEFVGATSGTVSATFNAVAATPTEPPTQGSGSATVTVNTGGRVAPTGVLSGLAGLLAAIGVGIFAAVFARKLG